MTEPNHDTKGLSEDDRKLLLEFKHGCKPTYITRNGKLYYHFSLLEGLKKGYLVPSFTTGNDLLDLFTELQKRGWWEEFHYYCAKKMFYELYPRGHYVPGIGESYLHDGRFTAWLYRPERIGMICEFVRGKLNG